MVEIEKIKTLREETGLSLGECKKALEEKNGDMEKAKTFLAKRESRLAAKRKGRSTRQGVITSYVHNNKKVGVLLDLRSETDFVARSDKFQKLAHLLSMQVAAMGPEFVSREKIPNGVLEEKKNEWRKEYEKEGKPEKVVEEIIEGKLEKFEEEVCLLAQPFIKDDEQTVEDLIDSYRAEFGENITVERFTRYEIS